jgi:hypothetical protein
MNMGQQLNQPFFRMSCCLRITVAFHKGADTLENIILRAETDG